MYLFYWVSRIIYLRFFVLGYENELSIFMFHAALELHHETYVLINIIDKFDSLKVFPLFDTDVCLGLT